MMLNFADYYYTLSESHKSEIREFFIPRYLPQRTFYNKLKQNSWNEYEFEILEKITGRNFRPKLY